MIAARAAPLRLPRRHPRLRRAAALAPDRPREGRRDPCVTPSTHSLAQTTRQSAPTTETRGQGVARDPARAAVAPDVAPAPAAGQSRHSAAVASQPGENPPRPRKCAPRARASAYCRFDPPARLRLATKNPRGVIGALTANSRSWVSRSPPPRCGRSSRLPASVRPRTGRPLPGPTSCARRLRRSWRWTSSTRSRSPDSAGTFSPPSTTPADAYAFSALPHTPHPSLGHAGRPQPAHGPRGRQEPPAGQVPHPRPRRQIPRAARRDPQRRRNLHSVDRCPDASHERDHRALGEDAACRTTGPHPDLERDPPQARAWRVRAAL
jgi:hypothetical protein